MKAIAFWAILGFFLTGTLLAFMQGYSMDYAEGYFTGFEDAIGCISQAMDYMDDKEKASRTGLAWTKEEYRATLRSALRSLEDARANKRVRQLMEQEN